MITPKSVLAALSAAWLVASPALASPELARKHICMGCHALDRKVVGPAWRDVAARYAGQADAVPRLAEKIQRGGKGVWGAVPMPANPQVTPEDAKALATWILTVK